jgi:hypothetical protein
MSFERKTMHPYLMELHSAARRQELLTRAERYRRQANARRVRTASRSPAGHTHEPIQIANRWPAQVRALLAG